MRHQPRIRPREWMTHRRLPATAPEAPRRWWNPLSLVFRSQRSQAASTAAPAAARVTPERWRLTLEIQQQFHAHMRQNISNPVRVIHRSRVEPVAARQETPATPQKTSPTAVQAAPSVLLQVLERKRLIQLPGTDRDRVLATTTYACVDRVALSRTVERATMLLQAEARAPERPVEDRAAEQRYSARAEARSGRLRRPGPAMQLSKECGATPGRITEMAITTRRTEARLERHISTTARTIEERRQENPGGRVFQAGTPMVWRQAAAREEMAGERRAPRASASPAPIEDPKPQAAAARPAFGAAQQAALNLDGHTMDRLADDVLRRIDRRIRIERERRGM